jgi:two-component sensor histidine kinase
MARTQDLLTASHWEGALLRDVLAGELEPYQDTMRQRIALRGNPVTLGPEATLALSLAVHELATNAAKYGSLSVPAGKLVVRWRTVMLESLPQLLIEWAESGGPAVVPPTREGFGSRLIQRGLAQDLDGEIKLNYSPTGLICVITFPLHRVASDNPEQLDTTPVRAAAG